MAEEKDYLGETWRLVERAREATYFRQLDQELIDNMRQHDAEVAEEARRLTKVFTPILVPVDFSPYSTQALLCAADLADRFAASLIVLHVIAREIGARAVHQHPGTGGTPMLDPLGMPASIEMPREVMETSIIDYRERAYTALQAFLPPRLARYSLELRVVVGHPFERILETAVRESVGLIVLGTHGRTGLSRMAMGSVAERVVRLAPCPVLTVKTEAGSAEGHWLQEFYETFLPPTPASAFPPNEGTP
ncbi:hypothetical protein NKDENANG_01490 [Candidatus Entotheonellaceae bacterium PAL068K]